MLSGPPVNTSVTLDVAGWTAPRRTRVEDLDEEVVVAAPLGSVDDHEPSLGASLTLGWRGNSGPMTMPVRLVAKELRRLPMWRLQPEGHVVITQRRHHVRTAALARIVLHAPSGPLPGHLVDLSEGGLRSVGSAHRPLRVGDRVAAEFCIDDQRFHLAADVVRIEGDDERTFAGCRFVDVPAAEGDRIRGLVFARQARERQRR